MDEKKYPWVVVEAGDGFICARNGKDGIPETGYHYYVEWQDAQQEPTGITRLKVSPNL